MLTAQKLLMVPDPAGMARAHLAKWMAAATVVQRAVRAWLFRRQLQQWLQQQRSAAVALQAAWRGRQVKQQQTRLKACTVHIQASLAWHSNSYPDSQPLVKQQQAHCTALPADQCERCADACYKFPSQLISACYMC